MFRCALGRNGRLLCVRTRGAPPRYHEVPYRTNHRQVFNDDEYADDDDYEYDESDYDHGQENEYEEGEDETYDEYEEDDPVDDITEDEQIEPEPEVSPQCLPFTK